VQVDRVGAGLELAQRVERRARDEVRAGHGCDGALGEAGCLTLAVSKRDAGLGAYTFGVYMHPADPRAHPAAWLLDSARRACITGLELRHRDDAVIELEAEHGLSHRPDVAHDLLGRLCVVGEHVDLDRPTGAITYHANRQYAGQAAELVLELAQLRIRARGGFTPRPLARHPLPSAAASGLSA